MSDEPDACPLCLGQYDCAYPTTGQHFPADGSIPRRVGAGRLNPARYAPDDG